MGILTPPVPLSRALRRRLDQYIPESVDALRRQDAGFFARLSALGEAWRLFPEFASRAVFLDIETTGLSPVFDSVTMVGLFDGHRYEVFIDGQNLQDLPDRLKGYSVVVTFNGSGFDLRFLRLAFKDLKLPPVHIDLRWVTRRLGYRGGLKSIEKEFGIGRDQAVEDIDGHEATVLWSRHLRGDRGALQQLIAYNTEDVIHLKAIMEMAYDRLATQVSGAPGDRREIYGGIAATPRPPKVARRTVQAAAKTLVAELLERSAIPEPKIVGIDLTGSERRATGWAMLKGARAETKSLVTDDDLVRETVAAMPDIVSIGLSALCAERVESCAGAIGRRRSDLPKVRVGVEEDGNFRFWALLPSMKSLTMRGMWLADELRKRGLQVIESYPGAAQDILGIPRKGSSLEELKWGLNRAGISGHYLKERVSHDEVDAITSALVGLFFLAGDFIALGTQAEDYLIVPKSPRINYAKLSEILAQTGLDELSAGDTGVRGLHAEPALIAASA